MASAESNEQLFVTTALKSWDQWTGRITRLFTSLSDEKMLTEIAPGKNRPIYLLGHLAAVHDAMVPQLRLGEAEYPNLAQPFLKEADGVNANIPSIAELRQNWTDIHARLTQLFSELTPEQWLERHSSVSEEDFAKEPHRNRLGLLLSRTAHVSYHAGQLVLQPK